MNRTKLEIKLNQDRVWALESFSALSADDLNRGLTTSRANAESKWSAGDHLVHLAGIEVAFNRIIRRHLEGQSDPIGIAVSPDGARRSQEEIMNLVHAMNEAWVQEHGSKSLDEIVALGQKVRAETLALLASLTDEQLAEKVPGAPWGDATVGGILAINGDHARQHYEWVRAALAGEKQ